jgi:hypothetical protein
MRWTDPERRSGGLGGFQADVDHLAAGDMRLYRDSRPTSVSREWFGSCEPITGCFARPGTNLTTSVRAVAARTRDGLVDDRAHFPTAAGVVETDGVHACSLFDVDPFLRHEPERTSRRGG